MKIYLVRHGNALSSEENQKRPLSGDGREDVERVASHLKSEGVKVEKVYHSGKLRAQQTAEIFSKNLCDGIVQQIGGMKPNDDVKNFFSEIEGDNLMFVGHLPFMEKAVSWLTVGNDSAEIIKFAAGSAVCIERSEEEGFRVSWFITPNIS
ncbi:MAG: phosphohistidine phosphatase SixA [Victivallales bacterium]|nr:phosphohistidine phosphatase SixA [Victivallales bacterium]